MPFMKLVVEIGVFFKQDWIAFFSSLRSFVEVIGPKGFIWKELEDSWIILGKYGGSAIKLIIEVGYNFEFGWEWILQRRLLLQNWDFNQFHSLSLFMWFRELQHIIYRQQFFPNNLLRFINIEDFYDQVDFFVIVSLLDCFEGKTENHSIVFVEEKWSVDSSHNLLS